MTTLDLTASSDAHEDSTGANFSSSATAVTCSSHTAPATPNRAYNGGFEFVLTAEIPAGATIDAAYITVQANALAADDPNVDIAAEDSADAPDFTTNPDVTSRTRTTASTQWTATGIGTSPVNSPSIVSVIQELVDDNGGLANGAGIVIFMDGRSDAISTFAVVSLEGTGAAAALHIEFTAVASGVADDVLLATAEAADTLAIGPRLSAATLPETVDGAGLAAALFGDVVSGVVVSTAVLAGAVGGVGAAAATLPAPIPGPKLAAATLATQVVGPHLAVAT